MEKEIINKRLSELKTSEEGVITKVFGHGSFRNRITEMGFVRGKTVRVIKNAPLSDPIEYEIMGYRIALRKSEAELIEVSLPSGGTAGSGLPSGGTFRDESVNRFQHVTGRTINVALVGNPNSGKTSLFNVASGSHERVGNYSGVTVDAKQAVFRQDGYTFNLFDLPGTYSITEYTPEELYVRRHILDAMPDVVINVLDASNLERNLFLTTQLIDMNLLLIVAVDLFQHFWHEIFRLYVMTDLPRKGDGHHGPPAYFFLMWNFMLLALTVALSVAIKMTGNWYRTEAEKQEIEKERTQAELKNLKSQLNPHFLFNTLNNIYALIQLNPPQAQYAVHSLSHLLRYVLYDNNQNLISLDKEFAFMKNYIELMSLRLSSDQVKLNIDIPDDGRGYMVAPLLFITLIENAFKHGVSPSEKSFVSIAFRITEADTLVCTIENSYFPKDDHDRSGSGIGLDNLRKRLNLIYPNRHILRTERLGDRYMSQLIINL